LIFAKRRGEKNERTLTGGISRTERGEEARDLAPRHLREFKEKRSNQKPSSITPQNDLFSKGRTEDLGNGKKGGLLYDWKEAAIKSRKASWELPKGDSRWDCFYFINGTGGEVSAEPQPSIEKGERRNCKSTPTCTERKRAQQTQTGKKEVISLLFLRTGLGSCVSRLEGEPNSSRRAETIQWGKNEASRTPLFERNRNEWAGGEENTEWACEIALTQEKGEKNRP